MWVYNMLDNEKIIHKCGYWSLTTHRLLFSEDSIKYATTTDYKYSSMIGVSVDRIRPHFTYNFIVGGVGTIGSGLLLNISGWFLILTVLSISLIVESFVTKRYKVEVTLVTNEKISLPYDSKFIQLLRAQIYN